MNLNFSKEDLEEIVYIYGKYHTKENRKEFWNIKYGNSDNHYEADKGECVKIIRNSGQK